MNDDDRERGEHRQHPEAGLDRRVVEDLLEELRDVEHRREEHRRQQQDDQAGSAEPLRPDHVGRDQRPRSGPALDADEGDDQDGREAEHRDHPPVAPAPVDGLIEGEQEEDEAAGEGRHPGVVDPLLRELLRLVDVAPGHEHREGGDRDVDDEDPAPVERLGEGAAEQRADGVADAGDAEDQPAGQAGLRFRQRRERHAEDRRPHQRAADRPSRPGRRSGRRGRGLPRRAPRRRRTGSSR